MFKKYFFSIIICNNDYSNIKKDNSQLKSKLIKNQNNNILNIILVNSLYSHYSNVNLLSPNEKIFPFKKEEIYSRRK